jgi:hypothetical protein
MLTQQAMLTLRSPSLLRANNPTLQHSRHLPPSELPPTPAHPTVIELPTGKEDKDTAPPPYTISPVMMNRNSFSSVDSSVIAEPDSMPTFTTHDAVVSPHMELPRAERRSSWKEWKALKKAEKQALKEEKKSWKAERKIEKEVMRRERRLS